MTITTVNIYRNNGEWCYAAFGAEGFDHSDTIGVPDAADDSVAENAVANMFPEATPHRVEDTAIA